MSRAPNRSTPVLNVVRAPEGVTRIPGSRSGRFVRPAFSTEPCAECPSRCCQMRVPIMVVEALRLSFTLLLDLDQVVEPTRAHDDLEGKAGFAFRLDDGPSFVALRRKGSYCAQLVRPGEPTSRCGVHAIRPSPCRFYPFVLDVDGEAVSFGAQRHCPVQWLQDDELSARIEEDLARWRADLEEERTLVARWNRARRRERSFPAFAAWVLEDAAPRLGYDPGRLRRLS